MRQTFIHMFLEINQSRSIIDHLNPRITVTCQKQYAHLHTRIYFASIIQILLRVSLNISSNYNRFLNVKQHINIIS